MADPLFIILTIHISPSLACNSDMKFFLEFVSCCGSAFRSSVSTTTSPPPAQEETRSLVHSPPPSRPNTSRYRRRKRGRVTVSRSGSVVEWRPSLCAISEDNDVPEKAAPETVRSERILKRKVESTARVHVRSYSDDIGRAPLSAFVPAFSPTPFLF